VQDLLEREKMRFHIICDRFIYRGGIPKVAFFQIRGLQELGHEIKVWTSEFDFPWFDVEHEIIPVRSFRLSPFTTHLKRIKVPEDEIVVSHGAIMGNHFLQCKRFYYVNYGYRPLSMHWRSILDLLALSVQVFRAEKTISISKYCRRQQLRTFGRGSAVVYPGIDIGFFRPTGVSKEYDLCSLARENKKAKNEHLLRETFPALKFVSNVTDEELAAFYNKGKIYVSLAPWEGFGLYLAEAMSCGVPVVALDAAAVREVVNGGGVVCKSLAEVERAVATLLGNTASYDRLSRQGRARVIQDFDYRAQAKKLVRILTG
jgi:glycosyltransferase involved in cell wall biosynthesis